MKEIRVNVIYPDDRLKNDSGTNIEIQCRYSDGHIDKSQSFYACPDYFDLAGVLWTFVKGIDRYVEGGKLDE